MPASRAQHVRWAEAAEVDWRVYCGSLPHGGISIVPLSLRQLSQVEHWVGSQDADPIPAARQQVLVLPDPAFSICAVGGVGTAPGDIWEPLDVPAPMPPPAHYFVGLGKAWASAFLGLPCAARQGTRGWLSPGVPLTPQLDNSLKC